MHHPLPGDLFWMVETGDTMRPVAKQAVIEQLVFLPGREIETVRLNINGVQRTLTRKEWDECAKFKTEAAAKAYASRTSLK